MHWSRFMDKLLIRLQERIRMYGSNPLAPATYTDLVQITEDIIEILEKKSHNIGFGKKCG